MRGETGEASELSESAAGVGLVLGGAWLVCVWEDDCTSGRWERRLGVQSESPVLSLVKRLSTQTPSRSVALPGVGRWGRCKVPPAACILPPSPPSPCHPCSPHLQHLPGLCSTHQTKSLSQCPGTPVGGGQGGGATPESLSQGS